jgi:ABC-2 type transport system permease protein
VPAHDSRPARLSALAELTLEMKGYPDDSTAGLGDPRFTLTVTWIAVIAGLSAKTTDGAGAFSYPIIFLPFISSAFVPTHTMPGPVRAFADNQPVTSIVNTIRDLLAQQPVSTGIWTALMWCLGILIVAYALAMASYHRKVS